MQVHSWVDEFSTAWSVSALKHAFSDKSRYRISVKRFEPGLRVSGAMIAGRCFVFQGTITFLFGDTDVTLTAGQYIHFPQGEYQIEAEGSLAAEVAMVWDLPAAQLGESERESAKARKTESDLND